MSPTCDEFVPGFGDADADFHVIGDHPGVHGGERTGIPFTGKQWSGRFFTALTNGGLVEQFDTETGEIGVRDAFFSYLHPCIPAAEHPDSASYAAMEPFFDAELRAITADVLLPVGTLATRTVLATYTARDPALADDMGALHASELRGSGWLVVPITEPSAWTDSEAQQLVDTLTDLRTRDYARIADLGRFLTGSEPYYVR